jgi:mono/diheme cytochrome c family protein
LPVAAVALAALLGWACSGDDAPPAAVDSGDGTEAGAALYQQACASCHGSDLRGTSMGPSHLSQVYASDHHSDESFRRAIEEGSPAHHWTSSPTRPADTSRPAGQGGRS